MDREGFYPPPTALGKTPHPGVIRIKTMKNKTDIIERWERMIGSFLLAFGRVEWFTYYLLTRLPSENILDSVKSLSLSIRIKLILQLFEARYISEDIIKSIKEIFSTVNRLAEIRNTIAHNPLHLSIYNSDLEFSKRLQVSKYGNLSKAITIEQLDKHCKEINSIVEKLGEYLEPIDNHLFKQNRITNRSSGTRR